MRTGVIRQEMVRAFGRFLGGRGAVKALFLTYRGTLVECVCCEAGHFSRFARESEGADRLSNRQLCS
jgi:hypothetical protein